MAKPLCIYHGNCFDGFTAAWAIAALTRKLDEAREDCVSVVEAHGDRAKRAGAYEAQAAALGIARELRAVARPGEDILATLRKANQLPGDIGALVAVSSRQYCVHCKMPAHQSVCDRCGAEHRLSSTRQGQDDAG